MATTTVFNLSAVDRIEADVIALKTDTATIIAALATQTTALATLAQTLTDFISALGGGDQPAIDAATVALRSVTDTLHAAAVRDKDQE
jgi:hypothetical protein